MAQSCAFVRGNSLRYRTASGSEADAGRSVSGRSFDLLWSRKFALAFPRYRSGSC